MKRREFITLLGGAVMSCPMVARAQQPDRMRRIGVLMNLTSDDPLGQVRQKAFEQELQERGWDVGRTVQIDIRWAGGVSEWCGGCGGRWHRTIRGPLRRSR